MWAWRGRAYSALSLAMPAAAHEYWQKQGKTGVCLYTPNFYALPTFTSKLRLLVAWLFPSPKGMARADFLHLYLSSVLSVAATFSVWLHVLQLCLGAAGGITCFYLRGWDSPPVPPSCLPSL